ncbi:hypothetical protein NRB56_76510 [Nocardia sp. RB56]|uniref:Uncharacterized protein n=1 Tax=Nocardia aurantia TaxID=2585199 RepID=A0A7K0E4D3_9NOCA|nr:hypothetical protein [Nocardia aurantia]
MAAEPVGETAGFECLAAEDDVLQRRRDPGDPIGFGELVEGGRGLVEHRDPLRAQQFQEPIGGPRGVEVDHHQGAAVQQRPPEFPHREVEGEGVEHGPHVVLVEIEQLACVVEQPDHVAVRNRYALRPAGRPGCVDDIRDVVRAHDPAPVRVGRRRWLGAVRTGHGQYGKAGRHDQFVLLGCYQADRSGIREHEGDPLGRIVRVDRQVTAAGLQYRQQGHDQVGRPRQRHRDQGVRTDTCPDQPVRQSVRAPVQLAVADPGVARDHRDPLRVRGDGGLEQIRQDGVAAAVGSRGDPMSGHRRQFRRVEQCDLTDREIGIGGHGGQDPQEPGIEGRHGVRVEQIGREVCDRVDADGFARRAEVLGQRPLEIEFGDGDVEFVSGDPQLAHLQCGVRHLLHRQHHLEQWMPRLRPGRFQHLHQPFERHVGMRERRQVRFPDAREQFGERPGGLDVGTQHQRVDEHADQIVERLLAAPGDRGADRDVGRARQPRQQHRQGRVQHHEDRDALCTSQIRQRGVQFRVDPEFGPATAIGRRGGPGPIGGQFETIGQPGQRISPIADLPGRDRGRIGFRSQRFALPQAVVGVLHRQRCPGGDGTGGARHVGHGDVTRQRPEGESVRGDMVQHERDRVFVGRHRGSLARDGGITRRRRLGPGPAPDRAAGDPVDAHADRQLTAHIESGGGESREGRGQFGRRDGHGVDVEFDLGHRDDPLVSARARLGEHGAQRLLPLQHVEQRRPQRAEVGPAAQAHHERQVVGRCDRIESVEEPHPLLGKRQRHPFGQPPGHQWRPIGGRRRGGRPCRDPGDGRRLEHRPHAEPDPEGGGDTGHHLGGDQ